MDRILLLDTSVGTANKGDDIIMECCRKELEPLLKNAFELTLPTHVSSFHWYQILRNSSAVRNYASCKFKFACGTNLLIPHLLTHYPQWNINLFNYQPLKGTVLLGVGAGAGAEGPIERYSKMVYNKMLSKDYYHSLRDERSKRYVERLGLKAINTGCVTMWKLTPEFCAQIPTHKSKKVIFTITASENVNPLDQKMIDILAHNYDQIYFWPQGMHDYEYLQRLKYPEHLIILPSTKNDYDKYLSENDTDYVGTRLHGGIYAMRHKRRSIIIAIDERASSIKSDTNINCIEHKQIEELEILVNREIVTNVKMPLDEIARWKNQFNII